jgi:hypothetical protein
MKGVGEWENNQRRRSKKTTLDVRGFFGLPVGTVSPWAPKQNVYTARSVSFSSRPGRNDYRNTQCDCYGGFSIPRQPRRTGKKILCPENKLVEATDSGGT